MSVSFEGMDQLVVTFKAASGVAKGDLVTVSANGTVSTASSGDAPAGLALNVRSGHAAVQLKGHLEIEYNGTLNLGWQDITTHSAGKIKAAGENDEPRKCLVVSTDTTAKTACLLLW